MEGQGVTNQRTEPHKSLISKNVSPDSYSARLRSSHHCTHKKNDAHHQTLKTKQRMLKEDWEFFKQRRFIEEQVRPRVCHGRNKKKNASLFFDAVLFSVAPQQEAVWWREQQLHRHHENAVVSSEYTRLSELQLPQEVRVSFWMVHKYTGVSLFCWNPSLSVFNSPKITLTVLNRILECPKKIKDTNSQTRKLMCRP